MALPSSSPTSNARTEKPMPENKPGHTKPLANVRHEAFVQNMLKGLKAADAYRAAGYKAKSDNVAYVAGWQLLRNTKISARLAYLETKASDESVLTRAWLITQARVVYQKAIESGQLSAANKALEMLGRERKTFIPKAELGEPGDFSEKSTDELRDYVTRRMAELGIGGQGAGPPRRSNGTGSQLH